MRITQNRITLRIVLPLGLTFCTEYEYLSEIVKENLRLIKEELESRREKIAKFGYNSNERILADEEIKTYIEDSNENFKLLKK